ncbi:SHOCT domain-containing protein [Tautonia rosea]|uniref:hypothetical protein n=1 Tax=Tautonia rosea TaxID=2728037 RepID=UPI0014753199|nr:hypothetical protein [Tautonia rosea]
MPEFDPKTWELLKAMLLMATLLVIVALGIQLITISRRRLTTRSSDSRAEQADLFRDAYESGEISTEEYRQIQDALDRGQTPPPGGLDSLGDRSPSPLNDAEAQTETDAENAKNAPGLEPADERGTEDPDSLRSG